LRVASREETPSPNSSRTRSSVPHKGGGFMPGGVDTLWGLEIGALVGAGFGAFVAFGPGFATWGLGEHSTGDVLTDREGETPEGADYPQNLHQDRR
jgi:hypothetical protein